MDDAPYSRGTIMRSDSSIKVVRLAALGIFSVRALILNYV